MYIYKRMNIHTRKNEGYTHTSAVLNQFTYLISAPNLYT